jgi:hypothetical protein
MVDETCYILSHQPLLSTLLSAACRSGNRSHSVEIYSFSSLIALLQLCLIVLLHLRYQSNTTTPCQMFNGRAYFPIFMEDSANNDRFTSTASQAQDNLKSLQGNHEASIVSIPQVSPRKSSRRSRSSKSQGTTQTSITDFNYSTQSRQRNFDRGSDSCSFAVQHDQTRASFCENALLCIGSQFEEVTSDIAGSVYRGYEMHAGVSSRPILASEALQRGPMERFLSQTIEEDPWTAGWVAGNQSSGIGERT